MGLLCSVMSSLQAVHLESTEPPGISHHTCNFSVFSFYEEMCVYKTSLGAYTDF